MTDFHPLTIEKEYTGKNWLVGNVGNWGITTDGVHASELDVDDEKYARLFAASPELADAVNMALEYFNVLQSDKGLGWAEINVRNALIEALESAGILEPEKDV